MHPRTGEPSCSRRPHDQRAFVPLGTQTGGYPLDPRAAGQKFPLPRVRCFGSGASTKADSRPWNPERREAAQPLIRQRPRPKSLRALGEPDQGGFRAALGTHDQGRFVPWTPSRTASLLHLDQGAFVSLGAQTGVFPRPQAGPSPAATRGAPDQSAARRRLTALALMKGEAIMTTTDKTSTDKWAARTQTLAIELTAGDKAILTAEAAKQGLTLEEYLRTCLGYPP